MTELRMDAYYYGFAETDCKEIDEILSAVACAGKAFHHTDCWGDDITEYDNPKRYGDHLEGGSPVCWIQNAAVRAAQQNQELRALLKEAECQNKQCLDGTLRMYKGVGWNMESDLGPCPWCSKKSELLGEGNDG